MNSYAKSGNAQRGFTLIELVVVIVILGILAAFAVPRFMGLEVQARIASVNALEGSVRSAAAMAHSLALATGQAGAAGTIVVDGQNIALTNGYPTRASVVNTLAQGTVPAAATAGRFAYAAGTGIFSLTGATTPNTCSVTYTAAASTTTSPNIASATGGC